MFDQENDSDDEIIKINGNSKLNKKKNKKRKHREDSKSNTESNGESKKRVKFDLG